MDDWMRLSHIAWDNNKCFYFSMKGTHVMRIIYSKWNGSRDYSQALPGTQAIQMPGQFGEWWNCKACELLNAPYRFGPSSFKLHEKRGIYFFVFTLSHIQSTLQRKKLGKPTFLQEVLDNEKSPALILTVFSFHEAKKKAPGSQYALTLHESFIAVGVFLAANINCHAGNNTSQIKCNSNQL